MRESPLLPEGQATFDLPLGTLRLRIVELPTSWEPFVSRYYDPFAEPTQENRRPDLNVVCRTGEGLVVPLPGPGGTPVIQLDREGEDRFRIRSHWQDGHVDLVSGEGELLLTDRHEIEMRMSLENFLRVACQLLLPRRQSFLLHSAGILDDGRCYLFFGHSGAGKSTITALSAPRRALSDDMVLIDASGEGIVAHAVPFFGLYPMTDRVRGAFPVAAAFRLRQDERDHLQTLRLARAVATMSASVPFVQDLGRPQIEIVGLLTDVCRRVPVYDLHFTPTGRFWELIRQELGTGT
jgi:hypothetical protein